LFHNSGFYTNRILYREILEIFKITEFEIVKLHPTEWSEMLTPKKKMAKKFKYLADEDLIVKTFGVLLKMD